MFLSSGVSLRQPNGSFRRTCFTGQHFHSYEADVWSIEASTTESIITTRSSNGGREYVERRLTKIKTTMVSALALNSTFAIIFERQLQCETASPRLNIFCLYVMYLVYRSMICQSHIILST